MAEAVYWQQLTDDDLTDRFASVTVWRAGGQRAPHKPLLILWSLARLQRGEDRLVPFADVYDPLKKLLRDFGPPRTSFHLEYIFWHLQSDGLWVIPQSAAFPVGSEFVQGGNGPSAVERWLRSPMHRIETTPSL